MTTEITPEIISKFNPEITQDITSEIIQEFTPEFVNITYYSPINEFCAMGGFRVKSNPYDRIQSVFIITVNKINKGVIFIDCNYVNDIYVMKCRLVPEHFVIEYEGTILRTRDTDGSTKIINKLIEYINLRMNEEDENFGNIIKSSVLYEIGNPFA